MVNPSSTPYIVDAVLYGDGAGYEGTITFSASGGPIPTWSIVPPKGGASFTPFADKAIGSLASGATVTSTIGMTGNSRLYTNVYILEPGNIQIDLRIRNNG
jgi:hypothetical protein